MSKRGLGKHSDARTLTLKPPAQSVPEVIAEWLCVWALNYRDAASLPAQISAATVQAYVRMLGDRVRDPRLLDRACLRIGANSKYFPRVDQIAEAYRLEMEREAGTRSPCYACDDAGFILRNGKLLRCGVCSPGAGENGRKS